MRTAQLTNVTYMTDELRQEFCCVYGVLPCLNFIRKGESGQKLMVHVLHFFQNKDILTKNQSYTHYFSKLRRVLYGEMCTISFWPDSHFLMKFRYGRTPETQQNFSRNLSVL